MDILKLHRSVRRFQTTEIPDNILNDILESGIRASNTGNMQLYSIIVTRESKKKDLLAPFHFNQPMVRQAPLLLTICLDFNRFYKWCNLNNAEPDFFNLLWLLNGSVDASILAQTICVAAESNGLGICYLGTTLYNAPEIISALKLPKGVIPVTALSIGYPEVVPELTDRLPMNAVVHFEEYSDFTGDQIKEFYFEKENLESSVAFVKENGKENLAQVYTEVRYKSADSRHFSAKLLKLLLEQGFDFEV
jgi:nitroreductase